MTYNAANILKETEALDPGQKDKIAKLLFSDKYFIAYILKEILFPIFKNSTLKEIVNNCLIDLDTPEHETVRKLNTELVDSLAPTTIQDLVFKVHYPKNHLLKVSDQRETFFINIEAQTTNLSEIGGMNRIKLYSSKMFLSENSDLETTSEFYKNALSTLSIWIFFDPPQKFKNRIRYSMDATSAYYNEPEQFVDFKLDLSKLPTSGAIIINVGEEGFDKRKDIFGFLWTLFTGTLEEKIRMCEEIGIPITNREVIGMSVSEGLYNLGFINGEKKNKKLYEQRIIDSRRAGIEEGRQEGLNLAKNNFIKTLIDRGMTTQELIQFGKEFGYDFSPEDIDKVKMDIQEKHN